MSSAKVYSLSQILSLFSSSNIYLQLIDEIKKGFVNYSLNTVYVADVIHLGHTENTEYSKSGILKMVGGGDVCLKSGYIKNDKYYVVKIAGGGFKDNQNNNYPNSGLMLVFSQITGSLNGILMDNGVLTELRTAAASALATKYFAPKEITNIGIVGTGIQSRYQLDMLRYIIPFQKLNIDIYIYGRNKNKAVLFQNEMKKTNIYCKIATDLYDIGSKCNLIIMCTSARNPVLMEKHLENNNFEYGLHINCIGADSIGKQELDENIVSKYIDLIMVDSKKQCFEIGEIQHVIKKNKINKNSNKIMEFGEVLNDNVLNTYKRKDINDKRVTLFDSTGVAVQDVVISKMVYQALQKNKSSKL